MKLVIIMMIAALSQVSAAGFAQKVSLNEKNVQLATVIEKVRAQTGYDFIFSPAVIDQDARVNVKFSNLPIEEALVHLFKGLDVDFTINDKVIVLDKRKERIIDRLIEKLNAIDIRGRILDENGNPLPGATVQVSGKSKRTLTDEAGRFTLSGVDENDVIIVSYVGFDRLETRISAAMNGSEEMRLVLKPSLSRLQEVTVVNTGYQRLSQERTTGSVVALTSQDLEKRNSVNILQNLEGIVPGLVQYRTATSGTATVPTIRGVSTMQRDMTGLLYVVDGLPIEGSIANINPYDVETVTVLKDAAAAAIYGARASNGVVVITTKRAKQFGKTVVEASSNITVSQKPDYSYQNFMSAAEQVDWEYNYYKWWFGGGGNGGAVVANPIGDFENRIASSAPITEIQYALYQLKKGQITQEQVDQVVGDLRGNDFLRQYKEHALLNGVLQQYNVALRSNNGRGQNSFVLNYTTDNTGIINAFNRRLNLFYKGTYSLGKWFDIDFGVNSIIGKQRSHNSDFATNPFNVPAYYKLLNEDGSRAYYYTSRFNAYNAFNAINNSAVASFRFNHLDELERDFLNTSSINTRYYVNMNLKLLKGLSISPMFQYEDGRTSNSAYSEQDSYTMRAIQNAYTTRSGTAPNFVYTNLLPKGGKLATSEFRSPNWTARAQANYIEEFGKHGIIALGGAEFRQTRSYGTNGILLGYDEQLQTQSTNNINFGALYDRNTGTIWDASYPVRQYHFTAGEANRNGISAMGLTREQYHRTGSGYANATYTYDRKYNLFGSIRKDYADLLGGDEKYRGRPLWSVGSSWIISKEDFAKNIEVLNYLKIRASYGLTGNTRNVSAVLAASTGTNVTTQLPNASVSSPPNPLLRWEKTATTNIGLDFGLIDNRLRGALDWYVRKGTDLFAFKRMDPSEGFTSLVINNASMRNKGVELNLAYDWFRPVRERDFSWSSNLSGSMNTNKVTSVDELTRNPYTLAAGDAFKVGYPVRAIYGFQFAGLNATGVPQWYNAKGEPTTASLGPTDADALVYAGNADPKYNLSFNNDFTYKGLTLSIFAIYYGGHYFRARPVPTSLIYPLYSPMPSYVLNSWTQSNTDTDIPGSGQFYQVPVTNQYNFSDNLVRKADFIKVRNIVLGYNLPQAVASRVKASNLKLLFQVNNPWSVWTGQNDVHIDPETGGAPLPTSFVFGLNANF